MVPALRALCEGGEIDSSIRSNDFAFCSITTHRCKEREDGASSTETEQTNVLMRPGPPPNVCHYAAH